MKSTFNRRLVLPKRDNFEGWYSRGYFPHFDGECITQHVCFHLVDSLPQRVLAQFQEELNRLDVDDVTKNSEWRTRVHEFLDGATAHAYFEMSELPESSKSRYCILTVSATLCMRGV